MNFGQKHRKAILILVPALILVGILIYLAYFYGHLTRDISPVNAETSDIRHDTTSETPFIGDNTTDASIAENVEDEEESVEGETGKTVKKSYSVDLDGDGKDEKLVFEVETYADERPRNASVAFEYYTNNNELVRKVVSCNTRGENWGIPHAIIFNAFVVTRSTHKYIAISTIAHWHDGVKDARYTVYSYDKGELKKETDILNPGFAYGEGLYYYDDYCKGIHPIPNILYEYDWDRDENEMDSSPINENGKYSNLNEALTTELSQFGLDILGMSFLLRDIGTTYTSAFTDNYTIKETETVKKIFEYVSPRITVL